MVSKLVLVLHFSQLSLIPIVGIPGNTSQYYALSVSQSAVEIFAILENRGFSGVGLFCVEFTTFFCSNSLSVELSGFQALARSLSQIVNFFLGLLKGKLNLLFSKQHKHLIGCFNIESAISFPTL